MTSYVFLLVVLALIGASALYFFLGRLSSFPCRTIRDVPAFLQPVDSAGIMELLNPQTEEYLHSAMTGVALRLEQRKSLHFMREHLLRLPDRLWDRVKKTASATAIARASCT
jgi:hypothetical protein